MIAKGSFEVDARFEPPYDERDGVAFARASFDKRFSGPLEGQSSVQMLGVRTQVEGSAGYVAVERIEGTLDGRTGSFALVHCGRMGRGDRSLSVHVVADSGTGELSGITGEMDIEVVDGKHLYELNYVLPD